MFTVQLPFVLESRNCYLSSVHSCLLGRYIRHKLWSINNSAIYLGTLITNYNIRHNYYPLYFENGRFTPSVFIFLQSF